MDLLVFSWYLKARFKKSETDTKKNKVQIDDKLYCKTLKHQEKSLTKAKLNTFIYGTDSFGKIMLLTYSLVFIYLFNTFFNLVN